MNRIILFIIEKKPFYSGSLNEHPKEAVGEIG